MAIQTPPPIPQANFPLVQTTLQPVQAWWQYLNGLDGVVRSTVTATNTLNAATPINSGQLTFVSSTQLKFAPYNGDGIKINGIIYQIPSAGITGLGNTGVYVNGVASQNLVASTMYYVYCFNNAGTLTADYSTTGYAISATPGNVGTVVKNGDDTRTLIGLVQVNGSTQFADNSTTRYVRSWFNRRSATGVLGVTAWGPGTSNSFWSGALGGPTLLCWTNEVLNGNATGYFNSDTLGGVSYAGLALDAFVSVYTYNLMIGPNAGYWTSSGISYTWLIAAEGIHQLLLSFQTGAGTNASGAHSITGTIGP